MSKKHKRLTDVWAVNLNFRFWDVAKNLDRLEKWYGGELKIE
jgi:hypothetical protein